MFEYGNITRIVDILLANNTFTGGVWGVVMVILIWAISFFSLKNYDSSRAFAYASTITAITSSIFFAMGLISSWVLALMIFFGALSVVYLFTTKSQR